MDIFGIFFKLLFTSFIPIIIQVGFPGGSDGPAVWETQVQSLGQEDPLEKEMETHSIILTWRIPWTEEPGRLQSMGSQRVWHDWATKRTHYLSLLLFVCFGAFPHFRQTYLYEIICLLFFQIPIYRRSFSESESDYRYTNHQTDGKNKIYKIHRKSDPKQVNLYLWYYLNHLFIQCIKYINFKNRQFAQLMVKYIQMSCQMGLITQSW